MPSEAQKRADRKYKHEKTRQFCLRFYPSDTEIWTFLSEQENKQGFLKGLISREMEAAPGGQATTAFRSAETRRSERGAGHRGASAGGSSYNGGLDSVGRADS